MKEKGNERPVFTELDKVTELYAISEKENRRLKVIVHRLERQLNEVPEDAPDAGEILELLDLWWERVKDSNANVAHDLDSTRAAKVRITLKRRKRKAKKDGLPASFALLECRKAIIGVTLDDWAMGRNPKSGGKSFNDIADHILKDDGTLEKFAAMFDQWCSLLTMEPLAKEQAVSIQQARSQRERATVEKRRHWEQVEREDPGEMILRALTHGGWEWKQKPGGKGWMAQCPAHQGHDMNLSIDWGRYGDRLVLKCWSHGCETPYVMEALGEPTYKLFKNPKERAA